jgi:7-cyano-7-deazaguanine synthase
MTRKHAVAIVSGGMDSTVLAYRLKDEGYTAHLLSFNYGQRHKKELDFAQMTAERLDFGWTLIDLSSVSGLIATSALTSPDIAVPLGHYADASMAATVVPNRNMMMLAIAGAVAVAQNAALLAIGVHAGDHPIYPDCRLDFIEQFAACLRTATDGYADPEITLYAPFVEQSKADIAAEGDRLQVPWNETWSCYQGGDFHCGQCGTCVERREAFALVGVTDPTIYQGPSLASARGAVLPV